MSNTGNTLRVHKDSFLSDCQLRPLGPRRKIYVEKARYSFVDLRGRREDPSYPEATFPFSCGLAKIRLVPLGNHVRYHQRLRNPGSTTDITMFAFAFTQAPSMGNTSMKVALSSLYVYGLCCGFS